MMNIIHWKIIITVAETNNISRSADIIGISQSGASQAINQVEKALGIKIFIRDRKQTSVTAIGIQIIEKAKKMIAEFEFIQNLVNEEKGLHSGQIRIASFPSVFTSFLPSVIHKFRRLHPDINIVSLEATDTEIDDWLHKNIVDLGVVMNPSPEQNSVILGRDSWVVAVPTGHHLARRPTSDTISLPELIDEPFIATTGGCHLHGQTLMEQEGYTLRNIKLKVKELKTTYTLIGEGVGLSIVPSSTLPEKKHRIRIYNLTTPVYRRFGLVCSEQGKKSFAVQKLLMQAKTVGKPFNE